MSKNDLINRISGFIAVVIVVVFISILVILVIMGEEACHSFVGPWMVGDDPADVIVFCEGR